jgi:hypothetical protein
VLSQSFSPTYGVQPPAGVPLAANDTQYRPSLQKAFDLASPNFRKQLCDLNAVYINPACQSGMPFCSDFANSWGWRRRVIVNGADTGARESYIALSAGFWGVAPKYSQYETMLLGRTLTPNASYSTAQSCPPGSPPGSANCTDIDNFAMALLAALAHEVGHVRWYVLVDPTFSGNPPALMCSDGKDFFKKSWNSRNHPPSGSAGGEWRDFSTPAERIFNPQHWPDRHVAPPDVPGDIDQTPGDQKKLSNLFKPNQPWASGLAATAPDEDFVETYKLQVLTTANLPLTSLILSIPLPIDQTDTYNIPFDYFTPHARAELTRKVDCISP